jgi:hypothetical protein
LTIGKGSFEGDVAVKALRERMALAPGLPPEPPMRDHGRSFGMVGRLVILTIATTAVYGSLWPSTPRDQPVDSGFTLAAYGKAGAEPALNNTSINATGSNDGSFKPAIFQPPPVEATADMMQPHDEAQPDDGPQVPDTDDVVVAGAANKASQPRSPPAAAAIQITPAISTSPDQRRGGGDPAGEWPYLSHYWRCHRCAPCISPRCRTR